MITGKYGTWCVGAENKFFYNKRDALIYASQSNQHVTYHWHDNIWDSFNRNQLGKKKLSELYRERAQQLRDTYDFLSLHYSGGVDSHNILMSFINNNIHLDHVYVSWPKKIIGTSLYTPNTEDLSAQNILSEWDFAIEPTLRWLFKTHPNIKIEVCDWTENLRDIYYKNDDNFLKCVGWWNVGGMLRNTNKSNISQKMIDKGFDVASIYGFDKPNLVITEENNVGMCFYDTSFMTASNIVGNFEPFYWSPNLPILPFEMAYQLFLYYNKNSEMRKFLRDLSEENINLNHEKRIRTEIKVQFNNDLARHICYSETWPFGRFQAKKPFDGKRKDRDSWIHNNHQFEKIIETWNYHYEGFLQEINQDFFNTKQSLKTIHTKMFHIGKFNTF